MNGLRDGKILYYSCFGRDYVVNCTYYKNTDFKYNYTGVSLFYLKPVKRIGLAFLVKVTNHKSSTVLALLFYF